MKHYINGNKIQMGFALSAYLDDKPKCTEEDDDNFKFRALRPAIKFKNIGKIIERNYGDYGFETGCDDFSCEVDKGKSVDIFINGEFVYGPVKGGDTIEIL